jgi:hypothetical protein
MKSEEVETVFSPQQRKDEMNNNIDPNVKQQSDYIWQDREIRFDSKVTLLACRKGEKIIGSTNELALITGKNSKK